MADMENHKLCEKTEIEWEAILQQLPDSPGISLDDFLLQDFFTDVLLPSDLDGDNNGAFHSGNEAASNEESVGFQLSTLSDILFNDEDFENLPAECEGGGWGFIDINSFLADACAPPQHGGDISGEIEPGDRVETSDGAEMGKNEGREEEAEAAAADAFTRKRKRNRESAVKSRERKKAYEESLQAKCRLLEGKCRKLEQSLSYSSVENVALRHEVIQVKKLNLHCHGSRAEPAVLLKDSLQMESLLCSVIVWMMMRVIFLQPATPLKRAVVVVVVVILGESDMNSSNDKYGVGFGVKRRWRWSRKKMK